MGGVLNDGQAKSQAKSSKSRLELSVQAIKMFISKLWSNDAVGILTFNNYAQVILAATRKDQLPSNLFQILDQLKVNGGTTIDAGFKRSKQLLNEYLQANQNSRKSSENRMIMLTDVGDNSILGQQNFITSASESNLHLTIIGISTEFRSEVCECLKEIKGFNYFCAVNDDDIKKYVFETFDFGFFPVAHNIRISISSPDIKSFEVYGSTDAQKVSEYNLGFKDPATTFTISRMTSVFPSEIEIQKETLLTFGGLVLLKLQRNSKNPYFEGEIGLKYQTLDLEQVQHTFKLRYDFPQEEQYFSEESLREALEGYAFASEMRHLLRESKKMQKQRLAEFLPLLQILKEITPKSKAKDLENVKRLCSKYAKISQLEFE